MINFKTKKHHFYLPTANLHHALVTPNPAPKKETPAAVAGSGDVVDENGHNQIENTHCHLGKKKRPKIQSVTSYP